jgi:ubiquinone/menaquinone biosynthesis C-methylase UbiE
MKYTWEEAVEWLRNQTGQEELILACYYDDPVYEAAIRFWKSEEWQEINSWLENRKGKVLDIGAGRGISSLAFAKEGFSVYALEPDPSKIVGRGAIESILDRENLDIHIAGNYGESLPFDDESFDIVYGRAVLHHAQDIQKFCKEAYRVLKKGGLFIVTREHVISQKEDLQEFWDTHALHKLYGGEYAYLLKEYKTAIKQSGLKLCKVYGPFDSVVNYAPIKTSYMKNNLQDILKNQIGLKIPNSILAINFIQKVFLRVLSNNDKSSGRLFSFLAKK